MKIIKTTVATEFTEEEEKIITDFLQIKAEVYAFCNANCLHCPFRSFCESGINSIDEFKKRLTSVLEG